VETCARKMELVKLMVGNYTTVIAAHALRQNMVKKKESIRLLKIVYVKDVVLNLSILAS